MKVTSDHGEIIHFAGRHHLFPVQQKVTGDVRLATRDDVKEDEVRVGWPGYFRPFIDRGLVFLYDDAQGRAVTRAEAQRAAAAGPSGATSTT